MLNQLIQHYGPVLSTKDLGHVLKMTPASIRDAVSAERFPIPTYRIGKCRVADASDVATYLEDCKNESRN